MEATQEGTALLFHNENKFQCHIGLWGLGAVIPSTELGNRVTQHSSRTSHVSTALNEFLAASTRAHCTGQCTA